MNKKVDLIVESFIKAMLIFGIELEVSKEGDFLFTDKSTGVTQIYRKHNLERMYKEAEEENEYY